MTNFAAMGYWREGDLDLLVKLNKLIRDKDDFRGTDWNTMVTLMRNRLALAIRNQN
jgi:hypothetical protein